MSPNNVYLRSSFRHWLMTSYWKKSMNCIWLWQQRYEMRYHWEWTVMCMGNSLPLVRKLYLFIFFALHTLGIWPLLKATLNISFGFLEFAYNGWCSVLWTGKVFKDQQRFGDGLQSIPAVVAICHSICLYCVGIVLQCSIACPLLLLDYKLLGVWMWFFVWTVLPAAKQLMPYLPPNAEEM